MAGPTLAVWKFASCDGCQLTLLDCEDELLTIAEQVQIATFAEASSTMVGGPWADAITLAREHRETVERGLALKKAGNRLMELIGGRAIHPINVLAPECRNPFRAIVARAVEVVYAVEEALRIIDAYERPARPFVDVRPRRGVGHVVSEAPRGLLYHRYEVSDDGLITTATIAPPTSQNQGAIEADMANLITANLNASDDQLTDMCEKLIRTYDPCISCSTHFLTLTVRRM